MTCHQLVLLAAGRGTRLANTVDVEHKALATVHGTSMFDRTLSRFAEVGIDDVIIASGHAADALRARVSRFADHHPSVQFRWAHNPEFATTNNIHSLGYALDLVEPPFVLAECDVVFGPNVARALTTADVAVVSPLTEELNGSAVRLDQDNHVRELVLGRDTPDDRRDLYKTVNLYSISAANWTHIAPAIRRYIDEQRTDSFYEAAFGELIASGDISFTAHVIPPYSWIEVDDGVDLHRANELARGNKIA